MFIRDCDSRRNIIVCHNERERNRKIGITAFSTSSCSHSNHKTSPLPLHTLKRIKPLSLLNCPKGVVATDSGRKSDVGSLSSPKSCNLFTHCHLQHLFISLQLWWLHVDRFLPLNCLRNNLLSCGSSILVSATHKALRGLISCGFHQQNSFLSYFIAI